MENGYAEPSGIALPTALPHIVAGIELGFARGITNAIAVEVLANVPGMGRLAPWYHE